jgi:uncharacterized membrane protein HdeD (DUF308 family)
MSESKLENYVAAIGWVLIAAGILLIVLNFMEGKVSEWGPLPLIGVGIGFLFRARYRAMGSDDNS